VSARATAYLWSSADKINSVQVPHNKLLQQTLDCDLPSLPLRSAALKRS
jgi:hypothetical protein